MRKRTDEKQKMNKGIRGITLIALVVTIVVLLILAGVSINLVIGQNGLISKSKEAEEKYAQGQVNDVKLTEKAEDEIDKAMGTYDPLKRLPTKTLAEAQSDFVNETTKVTLSDGTVIVPRGHKITTDSASTVSEGIVITDHVDAEGNVDGNEWVWVPVANVSTMYTVGEKTLLGTTGDSAVKTAGYSNLRQRSGDSYTITTPGNNPSGIREPDLLSSYDTSSLYYKNMLNFDSKEKMAQAFVDDYKTMIDSVSLYHGFYIGRYELTENGEKAGTPLTNTNWYNLYKKCRELTTAEQSTYSQTTMIWGCQWDETMSWLISSGALTDEQVNSNSSDWGNYNNGSFPDNTGSSTTYMRNKIYDLAGNCWEWTQEAYDTSNRVSRGGSCYNTGSDFPASGRNVYNNPGSSGSIFSSRATLYIK